MDASSRPVAGLWLSCGAGLLIFALIFHGPPHPDLTVQMEHIAHGAGRWAAVHWFAATGLFALAVGGAMSAIGNTVMGGKGGLTAAWTTLALGAALTIVTAVAEATAVTAAARAGDGAAFAIWWSISSGMANGFVALALAIAFIAGRLWSSGYSGVPGWASGGAAVFGVLSALGWILNEHLHIRIGGPLWLISSLLMSLWLAWFGLSLRRRRLPAAAA